MEYKYADDFRNVEIRLLYDTMLRKYLREKHPLKEAREMAYDAVCLRFTLSRTRVRIIVNKQAKCSFGDKMNMIIDQNTSLVEYLNAQNEHMVKSIDKNKKLIEVLQYANESYKKYSGNH